MNAVRKELPGGRELFRESNLSFNLGAKIGVLGVNGSGKSTVLKILAGEGEPTARLSLIALVHLLTMIWSVNVPLNTLCPLYVGAKATAAAGVRHRGD